MEGIPPWRLQDLWAREPLHDRHRVPTVRGCLAPSLYRKGQLGSGAVSGGVGGWIRPLSEGG